MIYLKINDIFGKAMSEFPELDAGQSVQMLEQLKQNFGDKAFSTSFEMITAMFPPAPVAKGETWTVRNTMHSLVDINLTTVFELKNTSDSLYNIEGNCQLVPATSDYVSVAGNLTKYNLGGTMTYLTTID